MPGISIEMSGLSPPFGISWGSLLAPFWLHFGSIWAPFWLLFRVAEGCQDFVGNLSVSCLVLVSLFGPFSGLVWYHFLWIFSLICSCFFSRVPAPYLAQFWRDFLVNNGPKYDVFFDTVLGLLFGAFPIPSGLHFGALACTRLHFSHFHVSRKVIKHVLICHCFWLPFCFKNACKMSSFSQSIFQPFFFTF